ncbi:MAG: hypothetical protein KAG43_04545, partial [Candidatus Marithrix sp.]|nr:hypothetical protein [Candidatus Marithrix sp.]
MKKKMLILLFASLISSNTWAEGKTAEQLVLSKKKADMTYQQLMEIMGRSYGMINDGILRENKQMVKVGADFILTHPAPNHKPWLIVEKAEHGNFKQSLLAFDEILDTQTKSVLEAVKTENWVEAGKAAHDLMDSCVSCHAMWK